MIGSRQRTDTNHHLHQQALWACFVMSENRFTFSHFIYLLQLWWGIKTYFIQRGAQALYQQWQSGYFALNYFTQAELLQMSRVFLRTRATNQINSVAATSLASCNGPDRSAELQFIYNCQKTLKNIGKTETAVQNLSWYRVVSGAVWC